MSSFENLERTAIELFRSVSSCRQIADSDLCRVALTLAHVWASRKAEAGASALIAELYQIDATLLGKLVRFLDKLASSEAADGKISRLPSPVLRLNKGVMTHLDFALCWKIKRNFGQDVSRALVRVKTPWHNTNSSLSALEVRNRLVALYKATSEGQARNAIELALRSLGYPCPLDGEGHK